MNKKIFTIIALAAATASTPAFAEDDFYLGAAVGTKGNMSLLTPAGRAAPSNGPRSFSFYGGYRLSEYVDLEAGYTGFGHFKFGGAGDIDLTALHLALKGSIKVSESWSLFGKAGAVRHKVDTAVTGGTGRETAKVKAMFGIGAAYAVTPRLSLTAEVSDYGKVDTQNMKLKFRQAQLGLKYSFQLQ